MNALATALRTRRGMLLLGVGLLVVAMLCPTPWGKPGATGPSTAIYVLANWMKPEGFPASTSLYLPRELVFGVATFTNVAFLFAWGYRAEPQPSLVFRGLLMGAVAVDLAAAYFLRDLPRLPGYWLWVASLVAIMWAFVARPATGEAPAGYWRGSKPGAATAPSGPAARRGGLPGIVWAWIGLTLFWLAITGISTAVKPQAAATGPIAATQAVKAAPLTGYVNDFAGVLRSQTAEGLAASLAQFEKETSTQVAVAIYPRLPDIAVEDFTIEVAEQSRLGRKGLDNGAILSIFARDKVARLEVGYGLEGTLTDIQAHRILESVFAPAWNAGDPDKAIEGTLAAITATVREEYRAGKMPGRMTIFWRQLAVGIPRLAKQALPALVALPTDARVGITFFGGLLLVGFWDGFTQARALARNAVIVVRNLRAGRSPFARTASVGIESLYDSMKIVIFVAFVVGAGVGLVVVAGGGAFGSAGSTVHW